MPEPQTKKCEVCDTEIGKDEKTCPKCGADFEELEDAVKTITTAQAVMEKRRKAAEPKPCAKCGTIHEGACPPPPKKKALRGLGALLRKKGA
jgi:transposase